jgi:hypothetical protein
VSHGAALRLYRAGDEAGSQPEFTAPTPMAHASAQVHVAGLAADDWQPLAGLPVTTPARTLVDVAERLDSDELARIIDTLSSPAYSPAAARRDRPGSTAPTVAPSTLPPNSSPRSPSDEHAISVASTRRRTSARRSGTRSLRGGT